MKLPKFSFKNLAHELGHNLGMDHDFVDNNGRSYRFDKVSRRPCTDTGGFMDYDQVLRFSNICTGIWPCNDDRCLL